MVDISVGDTFLYDFPRSKHLHVVVSKIVEKNICLCVFISSIKQNREHDPACELHKGDYPFIDHDSYVVYEKMIPFDIDGLKRSLQNGTCKRKESLSSDVLTKIVEGAKVSEYLPYKYKKYFL